MSMRDVLEVSREAERSGEHVTAVYHSHVGAGAYLSKDDLAYARHPLFPFPYADQIVLSVLEHRVREIKIFVRGEGRIQRAPRARGGDVTSRARAALAARSLLAGCASWGGVPERRAARRSRSRSTTARPRRRACAPRRCGAQPRKRPRCPPEAPTIVGSKAYLRADADALGRFLDERVRHRSRRARNPPRPARAARPALRRRRVRRGRSARRGAAGVVARSRARCYSRSRPRPAAATCRSSSGARPSARCGA